MTKPRKVQTRSKAFDELLRDKEEYETIYPAAELIDMVEVDTDRDTGMVSILLSRSNEIDPSIDQYKTKFICELDAATAAALASQICEEISSLLCTNKLTRRDKFDPGINLNEILDK